jgi:hypothetical protein
MGKKVAGWVVARATAPWQWTETCQRAFERLKTAFITALALRSFDWNRGTVVEVDASNWAAGGTLSQYGDDGILYAVIYFSAKPLGTRVQL